MLQYQAEVELFYLVIKRAKMEPVCILKVESNAFRKGLVMTPWVTLESGYGRISMQALEKEMTCNGCMKTVNVVLRNLIMRNFVESETHINK